MSMPIALCLKERQVCIIGGGLVAYRKALAYQKEGAIVQVIALNFVEQFHQVKDMELIQQSFDWSYVHENCFLLYAATNDEALNSMILKEARKRSILCGCSMKSALSDFQSMYSESLDVVAVALSTNCPAADRILYDRFLKDSEMEIKHVSRHLQGLRAYLLQRQYPKSIILEVIQILANIHTSYTERIMSAITSNKKVIVLAYHGIADIKREQTALQQMQAHIDDEQHIALTVFFSNKVLQKARKKGYAVASLSDILHILEMLSINCAVQPMVLQKGATLNECCIQCGKTPMSTPLLESDNDISVFLQSLRHQYQGNILGLYHPSDASLLQGIMTEDITLLSLDEAANINDIEKQITVVPIFLLYGYHAKKDIEKTWMPLLWKHGHQAVLEEQGLLSSLEIQRMFIRKMNKLF